MKQIFKNMNIARLYRRLGDCLALVRLCRRCCCCCCWCCWGCRRLDLQHKRIDLGLLARQVGESVAVLLGLRLVSPQRWRLTRRNTVIVCSSSSSSARSSSSISNSSVGDGSLGARLDVVGAVVCSNKLTATARHILAAVFKAVERGYFFAVECEYLGGGERERKCNIKSICLWGDYRYFFCLCLSMYLSVDASLCAHTYAHTHTPTHTHTHMHTHTHTHTHNTPCGQLRRSD